MKKVIDEFGRTVTVDDLNKTLHSYSNKDRRIVYNAEIIEDGKNTGFYTDYTEDGVVDDIEERLKAWSNSSTLYYAKLVRFCASKNDKDKAIWKMYVAFVEKNKSRFFDEFGDFKKDIVVSDDEIRSWVK